MNQTNPTRDELLNLTVEELKQRLIKLGVDLDNTKKQKKAYVEMLVQAMENSRKTNNEAFKAPLKTYKSNYSIKEDSMKHSHTIAGGVGNKVSDSKDNSFEITNKPDMTTLFSNVNISKDQERSNNDLRMLQMKRGKDDEASNVFNNNSSTNHPLYTNPDYKLNNPFDTQVNMAKASPYSPFTNEGGVFKSPFNNKNILSNNKFTNLVGSANTNNFNPLNPNNDLSKMLLNPHRQVSSHSLKDNYLTRSAVNDALYNVKIDLKECQESEGPAPFNKPVSQLSTSILNRRGKLKQTGLPVFRSFYNTKNEVDYPLIMKVFGGSIAVYALVYYLHAYRDDTCFNLNNIIKVSSNNSEVIIKGFSVLVLVLLVWLIYNYFKQCSEYNQYCDKLATRCYEDAIVYFESKNQEKSTHHMTEELFIAKLSNAFSFQIKKFKEEIYNNKLKNLLLGNPRFSIKELVEDGEIKSFIMYNTTFNGE